MSNNRGGSSVQRTSVISQEPANGASVVSNFLAPNVGTSLHEHWLHSRASFCEVARSFGARSASATQRPCPRVLFGWHCRSEPRVFTTGVRQSLKDRLHRMRHIENRDDAHTGKRGSRREDQPTEPLPDLGKRRPLNDHVGDVDNRITEIGEKTEDSSYDNSAKYSDGWFLGDLDEFLEGEKNGENCQDKIVNDASRFPVSAGTQELVSHR